MANNRRHWCGAAHDDTSPRDFSQGFHGALAKLVPGAAKHPQLLSQHCNGPFWLSSQRLLNAAPGRTLKMWYKSLYPKFEMNWFLRKNSHEMAGKKTRWSYTFCYHFKEEIRPAKVRTVKNPPGKWDVSPLAGAAVI